MRVEPFRLLRAQYKVHGCGVSGVRVEEFTSAPRGIGFAYRSKPCRDTTRDL